jgi:hypothetical protein
LLKPENPIIKPIREIAYYRLTVSMDGHFRSSAVARANFGKETGRGGSENRCFLRESFERL